MQNAQKRATEGQSEVEVKAYGKYPDRRAREDIDCVLIASPEPWHAQHAVDTIASGNDVYLEKPMTLRLDDAPIKGSLAQFLSFNWRTEDCWG